MRIFGLKTQRFKQWEQVLKEEGRETSFREKLTILINIATAAGRLGSVDRSEWRRRMRVCRQCAIYDGQMKRCRPITGSPLGCGCYCPFSALAKKQCWADEMIPDAGIGWNTAKEVKLEK